MTPHRTIFRATVAFVLVAIGALAGCSSGASEPGETPGGAGTAGQGGQGQAGEGQAGQGQAGQGQAGHAGKGGPGGKGGAAGKGGGAGQSGSHDFVSDSPGSGSNSPSQNEGDAAGGTSSGAGGAAGSGSPGKGTAGSGGSDDAQRAIEEADIIQLRGSKIYALSRYSGLSIVDASVKDHLSLLGRYGLRGEPFEMYVRDNTVYAMFTGWGSYACNDDGSSCQWVQTSHIAALDVTDPTAIGTKGEYNLPGDISDSRIVGDVLYAVSYQDGYCWDCGTSPATTITSLAVGDPTKIGIVDKLTYEGTQDSYGWWRRSISVTDQRMYVAGVEWSGTYGEDGHSTVQVVDISDPGGKLVQGASFPVKGQIESRWQMDEYQGIFRVISQPGIWNNTEAPYVQTFQVKSSAEVTPLASLAIEVGAQENLRSARFDGPRAFAITAVQKDPLFTFDLSDPAAPKQVGKLEVPGWVYYMEPRGDRLYALGFDESNPDGALNVSLFDIAKLDQPKLTTRVAFGGDWGSFAEDQDRIQKAFGILEDQNLILVPFSGYEYSQNQGGYYGCGTYKSGIQLIDIAPDGLVKRGVAPQKGEARRAFLKDDRLFAVSDDQLRSFSFEDRDHPAKTAEIGLSQKVSRTLPVGDKLVRLSTDWWTSEAQIDIVDLAAAEQVTPLGMLDLSSLTVKDASGCYSSEIYGASLYSQGNSVFLVWGDYQFVDGPGGSSTTKQTTHIATIDITDPAKPALIANTQLDFPLYSYYGYGYWNEDGGYYYGGYGGVYDAGSNIVQSGSSLVIRHTDYQWVDDGSGTQSGQYVSSTKLEVVDLANAAQPTLAATLPLADQLGQTSLQVTGNLVTSSHWEQVAGSDKVRFFLDRIDVSTPAAPKVLDPINMPGSLLRYDAARGELLTIDYSKTVTKASSWEECYNVSGDGYGYYYGWNRQFDGQTNECITFHRSLKLLAVGAEGASLLDTLAIDSDTDYVTSIGFGQGRLFGMLQGYDPVKKTSTQSVLVIDGVHDGAFATKTASLETSKQPWYYGGYSMLGVSGTKLVLMNYNNENTVFTLEGQDDLSLVNHGSLLGWASDVQIAKGQAIISLYDRGVQSVQVGE